ncbi:clathrin assembly protein [Canna indica]|uniref:Clathrin assembly protein n=1 Tax=Canna indica TaxID=4628 RepID=A0AAQ3KB53_9LILI|nr:clathrin assembly protein [Canna indica]
MVINAKSKLLAALGSSKGRKKKPAQPSSSTSSGILAGIELAVEQCTALHDDCDIDKYVHELLFLVSNAPLSVTFLSRRIANRLATTRDPAVALRTLVLVHRLLRGGDRRFEEDMGELWYSSSGEFEVDLAWCSSADMGFDHSFLISYSAFLQERMGWIINHAGMLEPIEPLPESKQGEGSESILHRLSRCQMFLDRTMECLPHEDSSSSCSSQVIMQSALCIILRESFRVYDSFCDGVMTILNSFFELKKKSLKDSAIDVLKEACIQTPRLHQFYEDCKRRDLGKMLDYPFVRVITREHVSTVQGYCSPLEISEHEDEIELGIDVEGSDASRTIFSGKLETKISKVWVGFDEEDS